MQTETDCICNGTGEPQPVPGRGIGVMQECLGFMVGPEVCGVDDVCQGQPRAHDSEKLGDSLSGQNFRTLP